MLPWAGRLPCLRVGRPKAVVKACPEDAPTCVGYVTWSYNGYFGQSQGSCKAPSSSKKAKSAAAKGAVGSGSGSAAASQERTATEEDILPSAIVPTTQDKQEPAVAH